MLEEDEDGPLLLRFTMLVAVQLVYFSLTVPAPYEAMTSCRCSCLPPGASRTIFPATPTPSSFTMDPYSSSTLRDGKDEDAPEDLAAHLAVGRTFPTADKKHPSATRKSLIMANTARLAACVTTNHLCITTTRYNYIPPYAHAHSHTHNIHCLVFL